MKIEKKEPKKSTGRGGRKTNREQNNQTDKKIPGSGIVEFQS
jgi:hypothetical protein